ncbi:protein tincar-like isoform X2 [Ruditapes philippinarum]|uniref:protein tincar-like isoform X2 n=1 Tax=Ruditapes philippinarum TaxID=129788 RepID=UPI00295BEF65|nr:protein tincar-like isoform X2 [Ruditapes philippinarum]
MELVTRSSNLNSLWSIVYCCVALAVHCYVTYQGVSRYRKLNNEDLWGGETPGELRTYIALIVLALLFLPLFIFFSFLKVGNTANDGTKLGRDHALDANSNTLGSKIKNERFRHFWEQSPPFSPLLQMLSAFLVLLPEMVLTAAEVKHGIMASDAVWTCNLDFLFETERAGTSNIIGQSNVTVLSNLSFYVVPTPKPPVGGWTHDSTLHVAYVYMSASLIMFAIRYSAVFWFTNKVFSAIFATQLLFLAVESLFAHCGIEILYKLSINFELYKENINIILSPGVVLFLYILSGAILIFSTFFVYSYGAIYFQKKFAIIDKRHHPETYRKETVIVQGSCQDYRTHTSAMVSLVLLGILKGPILYDLVSLYRETKDSLILSVIVVDVCYLVFWVIFWTILTLKQQWQFRILDYIPLNQPVFMISNENIVKSASYHGGSIELHESCKKKRPSSLPSDLTTSESGFGDANSSEDERDRFEITLPTLAEVPGLVYSRRKGSTHSLDRRSRNRRNGNQRVTFHETVKRSTSTDSELCARRQLNIAADVHGGRHSSRPRSRSGRDERAATPLEILSCQRPGSRNSFGAPPSGPGPAVLNNALYKHSTSYSDLGSTSDYSEQSKSINTPDNSLDYNDLTIKNDYAYGARLNLKSSNMETQTLSPNNSSNGGRYTDSNKKPMNGTQTHSPVKDTNKTVQNGEKRNNEQSRNRLSPRTIEFIDKNHEITLGRRDSANYSLTSSQETASNDSDQQKPAG